MSHSPGNDSLKVMEIKELKEIARQIRVDIINEVASAASGHPGGSLSSVEIATLLYFDIMNIPSPDDPDRDRFVLSKGHSILVQFCLFAG